MDNTTLAAQLVAHLPGWELNPRNVGNYADVHMSQPDEHGNKMGCIVSYTDYRGHPETAHRLTATIVWPSVNLYGESHKFYSDVTNITAESSTVTVDIKRGPEALAKAILTKMVPGCRARWAACVKDIKDRSAYIAVGMETVKSLEDLGFRYRDSRSLPAALNEGRAVLHSMGDDWRTSVSVAVQGTSVTFERFTIDVGIALDVLKACKRQTRVYA